MTWLAVAIGGALGSAMRYGANEILLRYSTSRLFPIGVFVINVSGCLVIGLLAGAQASGRVVVSDTTRVFMFAGILGGFTTFSSFGLDTHTLWRHGDVGAALLNVAGQVGLGLVAVWVGFAVGGGR